MNIPQFKLEKYFARYEFSAKYLLCSSDCDGLSQGWLLSLADNEVKELWKNLNLGYTETLGLPLLREEVGKLYKGITSKEVLIVVPEEGIFIALNNILQKGDHVICTFPSYQSLYSIAHAIGCEVTKWQHDEVNGWKLDIDFLKGSIKSNTKLIIVNFPHNPTGYLPTKREFEEIIAVARKHNIYLFSDEMYRFLEFRSGDRLLAACEMYKKAISLFGMSKTFGMAGVRLGWLITKDKDLYQKMAQFKDFTTICNSAPSEILALIALRAKDKIIQNHLSKINRNIKLLADFLKRKSTLFSWVMPRAGTTCFLRLEIDNDSYDFCETVAEESGIMLLPSSVYDYDNHHIRLGFGRENMPIVLEKFENYLDTKFRYR